MENRMPKLNVPYQVSAPQYSVTESMVTTGFELPVIAFGKIWASCAESSSVRAMFLLTSARRFEVSLVATSPRGQNFVKRRVRKRLIL